MNSPYPRISHYPLYSSVRGFLCVAQNQSRRLVFSMHTRLLEYRGIPQEPRDWSNPAEWIPQLLSGDERILAQRFWDESEGKLNPRHISHAWRLCSLYSLLETDEYGVLHISAHGHDFIENSWGETIREVDYNEGLLHVLKIIAENGPGKRADLLPHFTDFLLKCSTLRSQTVIEPGWSFRTRNLTERGLVTRSWITYEITQAGLAYLEQVADLLDSGDTAATLSPVHDIGKLVKAQADTVRKQIAAALSSIDPYSFEVLIQRLLEAMGYENVTVTSRSADGGVDVVADIEVGITLVREVVQVKRRQGSLHRPVLDQLRGSLHRFDAMRGTIITSGRFSRGVQDAAFERGAAPITLIDGDRLIDLLVEHKIGVRKRTIEVLDFEPADFASEEEPEDL